MALNFAYNYAIIDLETGECYDFRSTSREYSDEVLAANPEIIPVPVNDPEYLAKYYINGNWYEDPEGTIPWTSSLL